MIPEFHICQLSDIRKGDFPLNHDCILKVNYIHGCPVNFSFFSCRANDSGSLVQIISAVPVVTTVQVFDVDSFDL